MIDNNTLVLNSLKKNPNGLTAYQILNFLQKTKPIKPMTIYRSLESLTKKGLIHKTNKNKTFHLCEAKHNCNISEAHEHNSVFAVCDKCGSTEELKTDLFSTTIKKIKSKKKFDLKKFKLEIITICKDCD
jgi:Fur family zinc uptake transcriptional regulator